jgi:uncharacterized membrane-anchored protein YjiN (DUF445 family)
MRLVRATSEAAMVGGLADWFAVTALFRHPLGIPIPHTAIIPARRQKIVEGIVSMIEDEWLSPEVIGTRLQRIAPSRMIVEWLRDPGHVQRVGQPEDIPAIRPYQRELPEIPEHVRKQAVETEQAIRQRMPSGM